MTRDDMDADILSALDARQPILAGSNGPLTERDRAIFRAGLLAAAGICDEEERSERKKGSSLDLLCATEAKVCANKIRAAAEGE